MNRCIRRIVETELVNEYQKNSEPNKDPTACVGCDVQDSTAPIAVQGKEERMRKGGGKVLG